MWRMRAAAPTAWPPRSFAGFSQGRVPVEAAGRKNALRLGVVFGGQGFVLNLDHAPRQGPAQWAANRADRP
jgi:hypothetical protein